MYLFNSVGKQVCKYRAKASSSTERGNQIKKDGTRSVIRRCFPFSPHHLFRATASVVRRPTSSNLDIHPVSVNTAHVHAEVVPLALEIQASRKLDNSKSQLFAEAL